MATELQPGTRVEKYRVVRTLGKGRAGEAYLAVDTEKGRHVALAYYSHDRFGNKQISTPFLDAVRTKSSFEHPAIAAVLGAGEHNERPYVAFEYIEGESLRERIRGGVVPLREIARIGAGIALGLAEAHKKNAFHHDLRPEKIILSREGQVKILDLGITRLVQRVLSSAPTGASLSSVSDYLAPEQVRGDAPAGAADLWALGVMMFEMVTGAAPYSARVATTFIEQVGNPDKVRRLPTTGRQTPAELADVIYKLLEKQPAQRLLAQESVDALSRLAVIAADPNAPPYSGLLPYVEAQTAYFSGRDAEIASCIERLQRVPLLIVAGASGSGKSSFVQAGLFARLRPEHEPITITPGTDPLGALAAAFPDEPNLGERLREDPNALGAAVVRRLEKSGKRTALFVDRAEQLVGSPQALPFLRALASIARDRQSPSRVIVAVDETKLERVAPDLDAPREVFVLREPDVAALTEIVQRPLALSGHGFDDPSLASTIANEASVVSHPLLKLSFLLAQMWVKRDTSNKLLKRADHDALGGVAKVFELYVDWALSGATPAQMRIVRELCLRLVTRDEVALSIARDTLLDGAGKDADNVLDRLISVGLILPKENGENELAHDALIRAWPLLRQWIDERAAEVGFISDITGVANAWKADGEKAAATYSGDTLHLAAERLRSLTLQAPVQVGSFVTAGLKRESRKRALRNVTIGVIWLTLGVIAVGTTLFALRQYKTVTDLNAARIKTVHERADAQREDARSALNAAKLGSPAGVVQARAQTRASLEAEDSTLARTLWAELEKLPLVWKKAIGTEGSGPAFDAQGKHLLFAKGSSLTTLDGTTSEAAVVRLTMESRIRAVAVSSKGAVAIGDQKGGIALVESESAKITPLGQASGAVTSLSFSGDGEALAFATKTAAGVLNASAPSEPILVKAGSRAIAFHPGGSEIAVIAGDDSVLILDSKTLAERAKLDVEGVRALVYKEGGLLTGDSDGHVKQWPNKGAPKIVLSLGKEITSLAVGGERVATLTTDGVVALWDLQKSSTASAMTKIDRSPINLAAFAGNGRVVTVGDDNKAELWSLSAAKPEKALSGHTKRITVMDVSADGTLIATGGADGATRIWNANTGEELKTLSGGAAVKRVKIIDKKTVVTGHADGGIRVWNMQKGTGRKAVSAYGDMAMAISPDGKKAMTAGTSGAAQLWKVANGRGDKTISPSGARFLVANYSPDSDSLVTGDSKGKIQLWPTKGASKILGTHEGAINQVVFDSTGKHVISAGADRVIIIWEVAGGDPLKITDVGFEPKTVAMSKDGTKLVAGGVDGALKVFMLPTTDPYWRAPLLLRTGPEVLTHSGFVALGKDAVQGDKAWRKAASERARLAGEALDSSLVCFLTRDKLELWDAANDKLLSQNPASKIEDLIVTPKGCVTRAAGLVNFYPREGEVRTVSATASAIGLDGENFVVAEAGSVTAFTADGQKGASVAVPAGAIAVGRTGDVIVVGFDDGGLQAFKDGNVLVLGSGPTARITRIIPGPIGTIAATDADGFVGLWDATSGRLLDQRRLAAKPSQLVFAGSGLYASDERGGYTSLDLAILTLEYCALLKTVWSEVPVLWSAGRAVLTPQPADHACK